MRVQLLFQVSHGSTSTVPRLRVPRQQATAAAIFSRCGDQLNPRNKVLRTVVQTKAEVHSHPSKPQAVHSSQSVLFAQTSKSRLRIYRQRNLQESSHVVTRDKPLHQKSNDSTQQKRTLRPLKIRCYFFYIFP